MSKCNKVKNPCKICLGQVSQKTGLQCKGACASWVHYGCLNYTPGKIKDIKAGIIKVNCPCPDCKTTLPKEYRTDQPYSCNNTMCPANRPPQCGNHECPTNSNARGGMPALTPPCPLNSCGKDCKQFSSPLGQENAPGACPPMPPCAPAVDPFNSSSDNCLSLTPKCASGCSSNNNVSGDTYRGNRNRGLSGASPSFHVVEQMCNTVGELSNQLKQLMNQMKQASDDTDRSGGCNATNDTSVAGGGGGGGRPKICPKPCYCPGNPCRR